MKRFVLYIITIIIIVVYSSVCVYADNYSDELYLNAAQSAQIEQLFNYEDQQYFEFIFGTDNIFLDYSHVLPYYVEYPSEAACNLSDVLKATGTYFVGALNEEGFFMGFVELELNELGRWEIISAAIGEYYDQLYEFITDETCISALSNNNITMLVGDELFNNIVFTTGLVAVGAEKYFDFSKYYQDSTTDINTMSIDSYVKSGDLMLEHIKTIAASESLDAEGGSFGQDDTVPVAEPEPGNGIYEGDIDYGIDETDMMLEEEARQPMLDENGNPMEGSGVSTNPSTGMALAIIPALTAVACVLISKTK